MERMWRWTLWVMAWLLAGVPWMSHAENLFELYQKTLDSNPSLKGREFSVERSKAQSNLALSRLLPQIVATGSYTLNDYAQNSARNSPAVNAQYDGMRGLLQLRLALFDLGAVYGWQSANRQILQSQEELEAARLAITGDLVDRYLLVLQAMDELEYVRAEQAATDTQVQRLRHMRQREMAKITDLYEVEAYRQTLASREIEVLNSKEVALEQVRALSGVDVQALTPLKAETLPEVPGQVDTWINEAVQNSPSIRAAQHAIAAAEKAVASSRAEYLPDLALTLSETYSDLGFDNRTQPAYTVGSAALQVTVPIYEGGRTGAAVDDSRARLHIAEAQYEQQKRDTVRLTRTAFLEAKTGRARIDATEQEVLAREKVRDALQRGYELGVNTVIDVLDSRRRTLKAQGDHSRALYDYIRALVSLRVRAGSLTDKDVTEISNWMAAG